MTCNASEPLEPRVLYSGTWTTVAPVPEALGEVAGGVIGEKLYLVGEGDPATFVYDFAANAWSTAAARPDPGNHHAAEVINGKLYLFGGLTAGSEGEVQIFDPAAGAWSKGADMPFAAGSSSSAVIGDFAYVAGGITSSGTTNRLARYNPATDAWEELAPMPEGRNHAASATDGLKLWVFGGRGPGSGDFNVTTNGFDEVQVYDPFVNVWFSSDDPASLLPPLPQRRGGMGKAVYLGGEFYVIGGETLTDPGATPDGVFDRVDVYDPDAHAWRLDAPLPTPRHGIFPLLFDGKIYVAAGGVHFGGSQSKVTEVFTPEVPAPPPPPPPATVAGRWVFYNNSRYDGNRFQADPSDYDAIATDKQALLPGQTASFANYTSYDKGINGIMVDIAGLPYSPGWTLASGDITYRVGSGRAGDPWVAAPTALTGDVRRGAGVGGSDRITSVWADGAIRNQWLQVTIAANERTGLATPDVFYFGNAVGDTGNGRADARVNGADLKRVRRHQTRRPRPGESPQPPAPVTSLFDIDRDGTVGVLDRLAVRRNRTTRRTALDLITAAAL